MRDNCDEGRARYLEIFFFRRQFNRYHYQAIRLCRLIYGEELAYKSRGVRLRHNVLKNNNNFFYNKIVLTKCKLNNIINPKVHTSSTHKYYGK